MEMMELSFSNVLFASALFIAIASLLYIHFRYADDTRD